MHECICGNCKNLKREIIEESDLIEYLCEFGFPSEECEGCEKEECDAECGNYTEITEADKSQVIECDVCGKKLEKAFNDGTGGSVYCIECYLAQIK